MNQPQPSSALVAQGFSSKVTLPTNAKVGQPLVVAEAPGATEDTTGITLHPEAEAGGLFTRLLARVGISRDKLTLANTIWQRPPGNELYDRNGYPLAYTHGAVDYWKPALYSLIEELQPPVIIGLGRTALETLTGFQDIGTTRGYVCEARIQLAAPQPCEDCNGNEPDCFICGGIGKIDGWDRKDLHIPTICTYHPAFLNYGQRHLSGVFIRDVLAALEIGEKGWEQPQLRVCPSPSPELFKEFCRGFCPEFHKLTADIETPDSRGLDESTLEELNAKQTPIDRMSFCYDTFVGGYSIPFEEPFLSMALDLIARAKVLRGWNWRLFDWPRLLQHGFHTEAREIDLMDQWRFLHKTLPSSLAFVAPFYLSMSPWKHEAHSQPEYYSATDAIVEHIIGDAMEAEMKAAGTWDVYNRHVVEIISTNHGICTQMARNGLPIDGEKIEAFKLELEGKREERLGRLQELVPESLKPVKQKKGLKSGRIKLGQITLKLPPVPADPLVIGMDLNGYRVAIREFEGERRYALLEPFNPASHLQVKALIRHYGHKAKTDRKTKSETSGDDTLKSLITKYGESKKASDMSAVECYRLIRECRAIDKVLGTYVNGWKPASDGLIHATSGIWGDMFRISWRKPNLAATVADKKEVQIAAGFRKCIACADDEVLIEVDWASMEAVLVAHFAKDPVLMRLANLGTNAYIASHILKRPADLAWSDTDLSAYLQEIKHDPANKKVYDDAKHTNYLIAYGGTPFLASELYADADRPETCRRSFWDRLFALYFELFDKVKPWQQATMQEAHEKCRLVNAWGYRMPFWNVFAWQQKRFERLRQLWVNHKTKPSLTVVRPKKELDAIFRITELMSTGTPENDAIASLCYDLGDEAKSALSFFPRDTGAAMLKDSMLALEEEHQLASRGILRSCAHDALLSICKQKDADEVAAVKLEVMQRPQPLLGGLRIKAEAMVGQSWDKAAMREWKMEAVAIA